MIDEVNAILSAAILLLAGGILPVGILFSCYSCCSGDGCNAQTSEQLAGVFQTRTAACRIDGPSVTEIDADVGTTPANVFSSIAFDRQATSSACSGSYATGLFFVTGANGDGGNAAGPTATVTLSIELTGDPTRIKADPQYPQRAVRAHRWSCFEFLNPEFYSGTYSLPFSGGRSYSTYISSDDRFAVSLAILRCGNAPVVVLTVMLLPVRPNNSTAELDYIGGNVCNSLGIDFLKNPNETAADACLRFMTPFPRSSPWAFGEVTSGCCFRIPLFFGRYYFRSPGTFSYGDACVARAGGGDARSVVMPDYSPLEFSGQLSLRPLNQVSGFGLTSTPTAELVSVGQFEIDNWQQPPCHCFLRPGTPGGDNAETLPLLPDADCTFSVSFANP